MANKKNKVKFGLTNVHYAKIKDWVTDASGANLTPVYVDPVRLPGAVSISIDANGENENFYADDIVYYVISNNSGYEGDLEIALIPTDFSTDILGEILDSNGVLVERNDGRQGSNHTILFYSRVNAALFSESCGVDNGKLTVLIRNVGIQCISGRSGNFGYD